MSNKTTALSGYAWVFAGTFGQNLLQFGSLLVLARLLTPQDFGLIAAAMIIIGLLKIFSELGVGPAVVQKKDLSDIDIHTANTLGFGFGLLAALVVFLSAGLFEHVMGIAGLADVTRALSLIIPIAGLTVVGEGLIQRAFNFRRLSLFLVISHFCGQILVAIPLALAGFGAWSLVMAAVTQTLVMLVLIQISTPKLHKYRFNPNSARLLLNYGFGQSLGRIANYFASQGDNVVVGRFLGASSLGLYGRAYQLMVVPVNLIAGVMDKVLFPVMAAIQDDNVRLKRAYLMCASVIAMVTYPISSLMFLLADQIILTVLGSDWIQAAVVLKVFAVFLIFRMSYKLSDALSRAKGSVYRRAWRQAIYAALVVAGGVAGQHWGLAGVAAGVGVAILANYLMMLHLSRSLIDFQWRQLFTIHIKHILLTCPLFLGCYLAEQLLAQWQWPPVVVLVTCSLVAAAIALLTWTLCRRFLEQELNLIVPALEKLPFHLPFSRGVTVSDHEYGSNKGTQL